MVIGLMLFNMFSYLEIPDINRAIELLDKLQRTGEVPPQKLQALQRVLQSEFCNAVREVSCFIWGKRFQWTIFYMTFSVSFFTDTFC